MLARLNSLVLEAAFGLNERMKRSPLGRTAAWRAVKKAGLRAVDAFRRWSSRGDGMLLELDGMKIILPEKYVEWYAVKGYERLTMERFRARVRPGMTVVDVGAHVGSFTLAAAKAVGPTGTVLAFEPLPENAALLAKSVALNGLTNVITRQSAVGVRTEKRRLNIADSSDSNSFYDHPLAEMRGALEVDCVSLDDALKGRGVDLVKIDVEGAEPEVLDGMKQTLARLPDLTLIVEYNPACLRLGGAEPKALLERLRGLGFSLTLLDERAGKAVTLGPGDEPPAEDRAFHGNLFCERGKA